MVWDGKWATTHDSTLFRQEVRPYFPPGSTLVFDTDHFLTFGAKTTREVHPNSSGSTNDSRVSRLKDVLCGSKLPSPLVNSALNNRGLQSQR